MIFGAIAIAWLAYLVPHFVRRREDEQLEVPELNNRFADSMRIVRTGAAPLLNQDLEQIQTFEVSTPQTRRAAVVDLRRLEGLAASRRRRVLIGLMAVLSATVGVCAVAWIPWWAAAIPGGLLLIFVVVARVSVRMMRKSLDARYRSIRRGSDEQTVFLSRPEVSIVGARNAVKAEKPDAVTAEPELVDRLNLLVDRTGAEIVLSSSWRHMPDWREAMKASGIVKPSSTQVSLAT